MRNEFAKLFCLVVLLCSPSTIDAATPSFSDFNTNQFISNPSGPEPKISLLSGGVVTNFTIQSITNVVLVSSNVYSTNIITTNLFSETTYNITNISQTTFVTNLYVYQEYISNLFVTNITISGAGNGPWILQEQGVGHNTTITNLAVWDDLVFSTTDPTLAPVLDLVSNGVILTGFDGGQWFGNGGGLTNLHVSGLVTNQVPATNVFSGGVLASNTLSATAGNDGWMLGQSNSLPVWFQNGNALTNLHYAYTTNAIPNTGALSFGGNTYFTNIQANTTLAAFLAVDPAKYETIVLFATNSTSTDWTLTGPGGCAGLYGVFPAAIVCTNKHMTRILVEHLGISYTNMIKVDL